MNTKDELKLCEAATPGPWLAKVDLDEAGSALIVKDTRSLRGTRVLASMNVKDEGCEANAAFIARFNPQRVKELLEENQRLRERCAPQCPECGGGHLYSAVVNNAYMKYTCANQNRCQWVGRFPANGIAPANAEIGMRKETHND